MNIEGRQKAARLALPPQPQIKGTMSPQPSPVGGGSSHSRGSLMPRIRVHISQLSAPARARLKAGLEQQQQVHAARTRVKYGAPRAPYKTRAPHTTLVGGKTYRTDSMGVPQGEPAGPSLLHGIGHAAHVTYEASPFPGAIDAFEHPSEFIGGDESRVRANVRRQGKALRSVEEALTGYQQVEHPGRDPLAAALDLASVIPGSRILRGAGEALLAAKEGESLGEAARAGVSSYRSGRGIGSSLAGGAKKILPSTRALNRSVARQRLFEHLDATLPRSQAQAVKRTVDQSIKAMVRNGHAKSVDEAIAKLADVRGGTAEEKLSQDALRQQGSPDIRSRLFDHFDRNLGRAQARFHKNLYDEAVAAAVRNGEPADEAASKLAAIHAGVADHAVASGVVHPADVLHQEFEEPPRSAGEVALNAAQRSGVTIKGAFEPIDQGRRAIIHLTSKMDVTTVPHELGHFLEHFGLSPEDKAVIEKWTGPLDNVAAHEKFAQGLESYIRSGAAPNNLKAEFKTLAPAFRAAYPRAGDLPAVPAEVADVYKKLLGHRDGLTAAAYFALRSAAISQQLKRADMRGAPRSDEEAQSYLDQIRAQAKSEGFGNPAGAKPVQLSPGEITPETGGELGALVRAGLADPSGLKAAGTYEKVGAALDNEPRSIGEMEKQQEEARSIARSNKAGSLHAAQQDALQSDHPYEAFMAAGAARKGMLPKSEFKGFDQLEPHLNDLTVFVGKHPNLRPFERQRLMESITRGITEHRMPSPAERRLMAKAFGREATRGWVKALRRGEITLADILNIPRAAMSSGDLSAGLRQGLAALFYKPDVFFSHWTDQLKYAFSEGRYQEAMHAIEQMPDFPLMEKAKISFTEIGVDLNAREEAYGSQLAEQIPGIGRMIRGSDRAYTGFLNALRANLAAHMLHDAATKGWNLDEHALESIGSLVNALTGRGNLPEALAEHRAFLNGMFFSPGLAFSRLNFLGFGGSKGWRMLLPGSWYVSLHPYARREAMKTLMRLTGGLTTFLWFAHMAGASVSLDPRNADFGKIRIGDTRFDIAGGFQQWVRLISELATGQIVSSTTGRLEHLGGGFAQETRLDAALQFLEGKAAPVPSMVLDLLRGSGFNHQPIKVQSEIAQHVVPLVWQDMWSIAHSPNAGGGPKMAAFASIPDVLGVGVQNYSAPGPNTRGNTSKLEKQTKQAGLPEPPKIVQEDVKWKSILDSRIYAGQSSIDKAKVVVQLFDQRYHANLEQTVLPHIKTEGQAEALYRKLRPDIYPSLSKWQSAVDSRLQEKKGEQPVPPQKSSAPAPAKAAAAAAPAPQMQETAYHIPAGGVAGAQHAISHDSASYIVSAARAHGLDPQAVVAVASQEGLSGGIGDHGTSFGPFQLHVGGAFPESIWREVGGDPQKADAWAWSQQGVDYALSQMSGVARGLHGQAAVQAIVNRFERPANPAGEIAGAESAYGHVSGPEGPDSIQMSPEGSRGLYGAPVASDGGALRQVAEHALEQLANGTYSPTQMLRSLASVQLQNTVEVPGFGHIRFQIPKLQGNVGKAARGAIALAEAYLGTPYAWGGESPKGFDCSGLLQYIYAKQGVSIPRTSQEQYKAGVSVPKSRLQPGDAVFFVGSDGTKSNPGHVGIYIGGGKFIEAPHTGATVRISNLAGYPGYVGARRYSR